MSKHTTNSRDFALRRLARVNRWLIAGSVALAGVLTEVAASAFPGKTFTSSQASSRRAGGGARGSSGSLKPPAQAPQATPEPQASPETHTEAAPEQQPEQEQPTEAAPEQRVEATPETPAEAAPETRVETTPTEPAPEAPVVSGGS
jgi:type IV secretory pathway VirB10-like protein